MSDWRTRFDKFGAPYHWNWLGNARPLEDFIEAELKRQRDEIRKWAEDERFESLLGGSPVLPYFSFIKLLDSLEDTT